MTAVSGVVGNDGRSAPAARGERIATPVCGLARNDSNIGGGLQWHKAEALLYCHSEERSDVGIRFSRPSPPI